MDSTKIKKLSNGLIVCVRPMQNIETVSLQLIGLTGSNYEKPNQIGAAHFIEHWLLYGTKKFPNKSILQSLITNDGGQIAGITSRDNTIFGVHVLKNQITSAIMFLSQIFNEPNLDSQHISNIKKILMTEIVRKQDNPEKILSQTAYSNSFKGTRIAQNNIGDLQNLMILNEKNIRAFYADFFTPDRFVLSISGNVNASNAIDLATNYFENNKKASTKPKLLNIVPNSSSSRKLITDYGFSQKYIRWDFIGAKYTSNAKYSQLVLAKILGSTLKEQAQNRGLSYKTTVDSFSSLNYGIFSIFGACPKDKFVDLQGLFTQLARKDDKLITEQNVNLAKKSVIAGILFALEKPSQIAVRNAELLLLGENKYKTCAGEITQIKDITAESVRKTVIKLFNEKPFITVI